MNWIGQDFSSKMIINLLPGFNLAPGYWQVQLQYMSESSNNTMYHNETFMCGGKSEELKVVLGRDVRGINITIYRHNSFPGSSSGVINKSISVHELILLNLAQQLLKLK